MTVILSGTPRANLNGVDDQSGSIVTPTVATIAGFNPILFLLTERGPEGTNDLDAVGGVTTYGNESFRTNSAFFNHQTALATQVIPNAPAHIHRVRLPGSKRAVLRVSAELATCTVPVYLRDSLGNVVYDNNELGVAVPQVDGYTVGSRVIFHYGTDMYPESMRGLGEAQIIHNFRPGNTVSQVQLNLPEQYLSYIKSFAPVEPETEPTLFSNPSDMAGMTTDEIMNLIDPTPFAEEGGNDVTFYSTTLFPLFEAEMAYFGKVGNNFGLVIEDLVGITNGNNPGMWDIKQFQYQLRLIEKQTSGSKLIVNTNNGDRTTIFALGQSAFSERTSMDFNFNNVIKRNYSDLGSTHLYDSAIRELQGMLVNGYTLTDGTAVDGELQWGNDGMLSNGSINLLGGINAANKPYSTYRTQDSYAFGGNILGGADPVYGSDGNDGIVYETDGRPNRLVTLKLYDEEVRRQLENLGDLDDPLLDIPRFPFSALVDSGFSQETKDAFVIAFNRRPDIYALLSTFRVADYTEPEQPPKPEPRPSLYSAVRPSQQWFTDNPEYVKSQYLTYTVVKSDEGKITDVRIAISPDAPIDELMDTLPVGDAPGTWKPIPLGIGIIFRDWTVINANQANDLVVGLENQTWTLGSSPGPISKTVTIGSIKSEHLSTVGTSRVRVDRLNRVEPDPQRADYLGATLVTDMQYEIRLDFDGIDLSENELYIDTESVINVKIYQNLRYDHDEAFIMINTNDGGYELKVGGVTYAGLSAQAVVNRLNTSGLQAQFIYVPNSGADS